MMAIELIVFISLMALGYTFGRMAEARHYQSILRREKETLSVPVVTLRSYDLSSSGVSGVLVSGNVVISIDYFKKFLAALKNLFGGKITSYETLIDRARREAILRMKEHAISKGAEVIINTKIETASISKSASRQGSVGAVEVLAYGTALISGAAKLS